MKEILPGVYLLPVPIPYPLKTVNLYLLRGREEVALVDTALGTRTAQGTLELYLAELGLCFADIQAVLLTHHHPDHYGLAGFFEGLGARVYLHEEEISRGHRFWREPALFEAGGWRLFLDHGTPEEALLGIRETMGKTRERVHPPENPIPLKDGEVLEVAGRRLKAVWTPGHADGHVVFLLEEEGVLLAGDALLERVSPNVGLWAYTRENPLADFLRSLDLLGELPARVAYAGHFGPIPQVRKRAEELKAHHQERLSALLAHLDRPQTAWELSLKLFPQELDTAGRRFAFAETLAHLEYLRQEGLLSREGPPYRYFRP
ncbi:MBL fold metallo-hydrolase [Thermus sediminis]|uniref:MBL fold metallo-hydrolase n=1 Tax=Thermus sediminis TaxID=1761908 RepID=UPI000E3CDFE5|nr:MBL fold metallo-hydrolase [Thermus sediminis]